MSLLGSCCSSLLLHGFSFLSALKCLRLMLYIMLCCLLTLFHLLALQQFSNLEKPVILFNTFWCVHPLMASYPCCACVSILVACQKPSIIKLLSIKRKTLLNLWITSCHRNKLGIYFQSLSVEPPPGWFLMWSYFILFSGGSFWSPGCFGEGDLCE